MSRSQPGAWREKVREAVAARTVRQRVAFVAVNGQVTRIFIEAKSAAAPAVPLPALTPTRSAAPTPGLVRLQDVGLPPGVLRAAIHRGELTGTKLGRDYFLDRGELEKWIESHRLKLQPANEIEDAAQPVKHSMETCDADPFMLALETGRLRRIK